MFGLRGAAKGTKTIAVIDLGTGSVGATLARLRRDAEPQILSSDRVDLPLREVRSGKALADDLQKALKEALQHLKKRAALHTENDAVSPQRIEHAVVLLGAPWSRPEIRTLRLSRATPFVVKEETIEKILASDKGRREPDKGFVEIERVIAALRLNGYSVPSLVSAPVVTAEITLWSSSADARLIEGIKDILSELLPHAKMTLHSFALASYFGMTRAFTALPSFILLDITAEVTEALLVREGVPTALGFFPQGRNLVLRTLKGGGMPPHEALSALSLARAEGSSMRARVGKTLASISEDWRTHLRELLMTLTTSASLPKSIALSSMSDVMPWFREALLSEPLFSTLTPGKSVVLPLSPQLLRTAVSGAPAEAPALLGAIFADLRFDEGLSLNMLSTRLSSALKEPQSALH